MILYFLLGFMTCFSLISAIIFILFYRHKNFGKFLYDETEELKKDNDPFHDI